MARAALLNLKGTQYQSGIPSPSLSDVALGSLSSSSSPNLGLAFNQLGLGHFGGGVSPLAVASPLPSQATFLRDGVDQQGLAALGVNAPLETFNARSSHVPTQSLRLGQQLGGNGAEVLDEASELQLALMGVQGLRARAQNGYTPVEQLILQAHARQQRVGGMSAHIDAQHGRIHGARNTTPAVGPRMNGSTSRESTSRLMDILPQISEDDFHATSSSLHNPQRLHLSPDIDAGSHFASITHDLERQMSLSGQHSRQRNHTLATQGRSEADSKALHIRSSTLPSQYLGTRSNSHSSVPLYDSNSSVGTSTSVSNTLRTNTTSHNTKSKHGPFVVTSNLSASRNSSTNHSTTTTLPDTQTLFSSKNNINVPSAASRMRTPASATCTSTSNGSNSVVLSGASLIRVGNVRGPTCTSQEGDERDENSPVVSPALTYSTRTPASLIRATPYSGCFSDGTETFKGAVAGTMPSVGEVHGVDMNGGEKGLDGGNR